MSKNKFVRLSLLISSGLLLAVAFNNCGKGRSMDSASGSSFNIDYSSIYNAADVCNEKDVDVFDRGYHQFLKVQCKNCHISGPGKGTFASPDAATAFDGGFNVIGYSKISQYAVSDAHNPPYTGSQNTEVIRQLRTQWQSYQTEKLKCGGSTTPVVNENFVPQFETTAQTIPAIGSQLQTFNVNGTNVQLKIYDRKLMTWNLNTTLLPLAGLPVPNLNGAQFSITVQGYETPAGETAYLFTMPTLTTGGFSYNVKGINFRLNGFPVNYATTFKKINTNVYQNSKDVLLAPGSLVSVGPLGTTDTIAVQFGDIEIITMSAPPPPATVSFSIAAMTIQPSQLGYTNKVTIQVQVTGDNPDPIAVGVSTTDPANYPSTEKPANSVLGSVVNRFDWDYKIDPTTTTSLTFAANQKTATFNIIFSDDLRADVDKVLRLELGTPLGAKLATTNTTLRISLPNYNPPYTGSAPTFAQLMNPNAGVLGKNCVKCHNSVQRQGGYDMTDYQDMVNRGIIVPGDLNPNDHKMYRRMNAGANLGPTVQSMPLDGYLPADVVQLVNDWILGGAKNN